MSAARSAAAVAGRQPQGDTSAPAGPDRTLAPFRRRLATVTRSETLGAYRLLWAADPDAPAPVPGQFAMIAAAERWGGGADERPYLPRAFSIAQFAGDGESAFLLEDVGPGTGRLCELSPGDRLWILGPLGRGFSEPPADRRTILVGGGIGIAALIMLGNAGGAIAGGEPAPSGRSDEPSGAAQSPIAGSRAATPGARTGAAHARPGGDPTRSLTVLAGFRGADHARAARLLGDPQLATDDGSIGHRGAVTDLLGAELERDGRAVVRACGPPAMLEAVRAICERERVPAELALEASMACGFGSCFGCVVPRRDGGYLRVCLDGPVIDAAEVAHVCVGAGR